jgi:hypothetical protein
MIILTLTGERRELHTLRSHDRMLRAWLRGYDQFLCTAKARLRSPFYIVQARPNPIKRPRNQTAATYTGPFTASTPNQSAPMFTVVCEHLQDESHMGFRAQYVEKHVSPSFCPALNCAM